MNNKIIASFLFLNIKNKDNNKTKNNKLNQKITTKHFTNLFGINKSTLYRWFAEYKNKIETINKDVNINFDLNFESINITKPIVVYIITFYLKHIKSNKNTKVLQKEIKDLYNATINIKQIMAIIEKNKHHFLFNKNKINNHKITNEIETFVIDTIKKNNCLVANDIKILILEKFKLTISLPTIYNIFKKHNYTYKKTKIIINPHSLDDQKQQLTNVYDYLKNNNNNINIKISTSAINKYSNRLKYNIKQEQILIKEQLNQLKDNMNIDLIYLNDCKLKKLILDDCELINKINTYSKILLSIDEMSIITNKASTNGWSLKNETCNVYIPFIKNNVRYSLLMATSNKKIVKYLLQEGSIKKEHYINFMLELHKENSNYIYLIDNASIHTSKLAKEMYARNKMNVIFNAPYQSEFNPIEMVFSLLRKKLNKKIVKNKSDIIDLTNIFVSEITKETLTNIFNHSEKLLKKLLNL